ncbi:helix-turn-helix domain-containing protein [Crossiella sp. SN42]|uniref:helix-turn-helix transcriptional regulator n=1 Tax=Crossiella sp. SN42 TaxID=2944808 RepID=UPI00207D5109|nr:helix-turn-helix domain-containing protein [Crossiella sp. SN42]MCO1581678.1 helix-turn-helix domain-containing protein [Crossiella sp. SN42]
MGRRAALIARRAGLGLTQEDLAAVVGVERTTVARWEAGTCAPQPLHRLRLAEALGVSPFELDLLLAGRAVDGGPADPAGSKHRRHESMGQPARRHYDDHATASIHPALPEASERDDVHRRDLLRLVSLTSATLALPPTRAILDTGRIAAAATGSLDRAELAEFAALNGHLWQTFMLTSAKAQLLPLVQAQIGTLTACLRAEQSERVRTRLQALLGELLQLAGEACFDGDRYTDAAHCYTLAAQAAQEAGAFDLWACALTRHAFLAVYERKFHAAVPLLELAAGFARRDDPALSTRHWVAAVQAETFAGLGKASECDRALEAAADVEGTGHNGGWLRFDGGRIPEQRGSCYAALGRTDRAEEALTQALEGPLSVRRRAGVLTDLARLGATRSDPHRVATYAGAALAAANRTGSGVIAKRLDGLRPHLKPLLANVQVRQLDAEIAALIRQHTTN